MCIRDRPAGRPPDGTHAGTKTGNREAAHRGRRRPGRPCGSAPAGSEMCIRDSLYTAPKAYNSFLYDLRKLYPKQDEGGTE